MDLVTALISAAPPPAATLEDWWAATGEARAAGATPVERALVGGAHADRLGFAFAAGYAEALQALVPSAGGRLTALCATEEGGAHPRAIRTALVADGDGFRLTGRKRWATAASASAQLVVIASIGADHTGRNRLRAVRVATDAPGVRLTPTTAPFVPEIPHAEVSLDDVAVAAADVLPGDGYDDYLKPFRTVEDLHVHAALLGYLVGVARRVELEPSLIERGLALAFATRALAGADPRASATHLALAGLLELTAAHVAAVEAAWSARVAADDPERARWQRDRPLLQVASSARAARRDQARAWLTDPAALPSSPRSR